MILNNLNNSCIKINKNPSQSFHLTFINKQQMYEIKKLSKINIQETLPACNLSANNNSFDLCVIRLYDAKHSVLLFLY